LEQEISSVLELLNVQTNLGNEGIQQFGYAAANSPLTPYVKIIIMTRMKKYFRLATMYQIFLNQCPSRWQASAI
jgi:hypothetical protein